MSMELKTAGEKLESNSMHHRGTYSSEQRDLKVSFVMLETRLRQ